MTPEQIARQEIDRQLQQAGWVIQNQAEMNIFAGLGVAVREFKLTTGFVDYKHIVDLVSLVRHAIDPESPLQPVGQTVEERFTEWLSEQQQQGEAGEFTEEQLRWLVAIKGHIASSLMIEQDDSEYAPFNQFGGIGRAYELFSDLDTGVSALERASVLKSAVEGRLTQKWRSANPGVEPASELLARILRDRRQRWEQQQLATYESKGKKPPKNWQSKYKQPAAPDTTNLPELPDGWCWVTLQQISFIDVGYAFKSKMFVSDGIRLLRGENLEPGSLRWTNTKYWSLDDVEGYRHLMVNAGEIILAMDRPLVSAGLKIARAKEEDIPCLLVQRMARYRLIEPSMTGFVYSACQTREFIKHLVGNQTGTQLPHISSKGIESFTLPLPPLKEQDEVEDEVARQSSTIDDIERQLERDVRRSETLRQSILKSAFEGRLEQQLI